MTIQDVRSIGCYVQHQFLEEKYIDNFKEFFELPETRPGIVEFKKGDIEKSESVVLRDLFHDIEKIMKQVDKHLKFHKLWFQTTNSNSVHAFESKASPFLPHIDTQRYTKAMVYLTDVNLESGPFTTSKQNPNNFEELRKQIFKKVPAALEYQNNRPEFDISTVNFSPILGKRGMLVVFDTNTPHFAGKIEVGFRQILRFDYWNKKHTLKNKLFSRGHPK